MPTHVLTVETLRLFPFLCFLQTIMEQFNPSLRNFIAMGKNYEKALAGGWGPAQETAWGWLSRDGNRPPMPILTWWRVGGPKLCLKVHASGFAVHSASLPPPSPSFSQASFPPHSCSEGSTLGALRAPTSQRPDSFGWGHHAVSQGSDGGPRLLPTQSLSRHPHMPV